MDDSAVPEHVEQFISATNTVAVTTSLTQLLPADPARLSWIVSGPVAGGVLTLSIGGNQPGALQINVSGQSNYQMLWQQHGPLVQMEVWIKSSGAGASASYSTTVRR